MKIIIPYDNPVFEDVSCTITNGGIIKADEWTDIVNWEKIYSNMKSELIRNGLDGICPHCGEYLSIEAKITMVLED